MVNRGKYTFYKYSAPPGLRTVTNNSCLFREFPSICIAQRTSYLDFDFGQNYHTATRHEEEKMNKKFVISVVVVFVLMMGISFLVHGVILGPSYKALPGLFRTEADSAGYFPYMLLAHVFIAFAFVWIYNKGKEDKPFVSQGICYGIAIATITAIPIYMIYYAVQPMPGLLVVKQIVFDTLTYVVLGIVVAWMNR